MIQVVIEASRLALAQFVLLGAVSFTPISHGAALVNEVTLVLVGLATGLLWSGGAFDADEAPLSGLIAVPLIASVPVMLLWEFGLGLEADAFMTGPRTATEALGSTLLPLATLIGAVLARRRWSPRIAFDEDPAAAWARHNREQYKTGQATGRIPDTLSFNPYAGLGGRELPDEDPWDKAPLENQEEEKKH